MERSYKVSGMTCGGCARSVENAIKNLAPAAKVVVDLESGTVKVDAADEQLVARAVDDAGFEFLGTI